MRIYLIQNKCPPEFDTPGEILGAYRYKRKAQEDLGLMRAEDAYKSQYLELIPVIVKEQR